MKKKNHKLYNVRGLAYDLKGEHENAQLSYGKGLDLKPEDTGLLNNLGLSFAIEEQYASAIRLLSKALNIDYTRATAQHNLFMVYFLSGEEDGARKIAKDILTPEEIEREIKRYKWLKTLSSAQRAQAIFLGLNSFPKEEAPVKSDKAEEINVSSQVLDPKKRALMDILAREGQVAAKTPAVKRRKLSIYRLQLGSYEDKKVAKNDWSRLKRRAGTLLDVYTPLIKRNEKSDGTVMFRLFVTEIDTKDPASKLCEALKKKRLSCLVLKTSAE